MTSVRIKFRKSTLANKAGVLYIQLIHNRKAKLITTRFRLFSYEWDNRLSAVIIEHANDERKTDLQHIKSGLNREIEQIHTLIALFEKRGEYSTQELAVRYVSQSFNGYFYPFITYRIKTLKSQCRIKTASIYEVAQRSFFDFRRGEDIRIDKIDGPLMQRYETYLKQNGVSANSSSCYMRVLRAIYNQAVHNGLTVSRNPFKDVYTGIGKTSKRAINESAVALLSRLDLSGHTHLQLARDLFMFSFYTRGMSFKDMANLKQRNLRDGYIIYVRSKTKQNLVVKVEKCMQEIIERYKHLTVDDYMLPVYNKSNYDPSSHLGTYNKRLKRLSQLLNLEKPLSSYVSRHSWATMALRKGIPIQIISEGMGHENEKTTRIYLASLEQSVMDKANARIIAL